MTYLADTDWMINLLNDRDQFVLELGRLWPEGVALSIITIAELYEGVPSSRDPEATRKTVNGLHSSFPVLGLDRDTAELFGDIRNDLRKRGELIGDCDIFIAATAIRHRLTLCSQNVAHFNRIPALKLHSL